VGGGGGGVGGLIARLNLMMIVGDITLECENAHYVILQTD